MMKKLTVRFYATPDELEAFLRYLLDQGFTMFMVEHPDLVYSAARSTSDLRAAGLSKVVQVAIFREPRSANGENWNQFLGNNPDGLILNIGRLDQSILRPSWLGAQSTSEDVIKEWRKVANKLKRETTAGAWVMNPSQNIIGFAKDLRFTTGALKLFDEGYQIAPLAGTNRVFLRDPSIYPGEQN